MLRSVGVGIHNRSYNARSTPLPKLFSMQLCYLYDNDYIFDKFECAISGDASVVATGTYNSKCIMYDRNGQPIESLEVSDGQLVAVKFFADGNGGSEVLEIPFRHEVIRPGWNYSSPSIYTVNIILMHVLT